MVWGGWALELADKIRLLIRRQNLNISEAAERCGLDRSVLSRLLSPATTPRGVHRGGRPEFGTISKIAAGLGCLIEYLNSDLTTYAHAFAASVPDEALRALETPHARLQLLLGELGAMFGDEGSPAALGARMGLRPEELQHPPDDMPDAFYELIARNLGVPPSFLLIRPPLPTRLTPYLSALQRGVGAGMEPADLDALVEEWIMRKQIIC